MSISGRLLTRSSTFRSRFLLHILLLLAPLLSHGASSTTAPAGWNGQDFLTHCPPSRCSQDGPEIRFPHRLQSSAAACGASCARLSCSGQDTILHHPFLGPCKVTAIDYQDATIKLIPPAHYLSPCPLRKLILFNSSSMLPADDGVYSGCALKRERPAKIVRCSKDFAPANGTFTVDGYVFNSIADYIVGPISCLTDGDGDGDGTSYLSYLVDARVPTYVLPVDCSIVSRSYVSIPDEAGGSTFRETAERIISFAEMTASWEGGGGDYILVCTDCERQGRTCGFSSHTNEAFCMPQAPHAHGSHVKVISATSSLAAFVVLSLIIATALYLSLKSRYDEEVHLKVEMFLRTYGTSKPTRYSFSDVKKITRRFKQQLGQGGFGSVYRGELPNGVPVAVKMLEHTPGDGEEFINEVATIGQIHHTNIIHLLGFCSEGTRRVIIYEFMPNKSLDKYIFLHDPNACQELLAPNKMLDIALGIARGIEYLHQGCNQRILHFDIKPHNILLDYNFSPKISDFGLAKLCARDQSIIALTAARGTMGYVAPELYSRNFGEISYKSDVYSYGMLLLEMVGGRRISDPIIENQNEVYFPEWIYEQVITGQDDFVFSREMTEEDKLRVRQMALVALWCIQWNPRNRPSMTKVVNMLTGRVHNIQVPPKPFVSYESHPML